MTGSQIQSAVATAVLTADIVLAKLVPLSAMLPPFVARWLPVVIAIVAGFKIAFSQSLSAGHYSLPEEQANNLVARVGDETVGAVAPALLKQVRQ